MINQRAFIVSIIFKAINLSIIFNFYKYSYLISGNNDSGDGLLKDWIGGRNYSDELFWNDFKVKPKIENRKI